MCGLVGIFKPSGLPRGSEQHVIAMRDRLTHRGPDGVGLWSDADAGIALGHRRLAIIDLSPAGHQPMTSPSGRYRLAFNGEIYNHLELRKRAEHAGFTSWRGHSDTEALLAHVDRFGLENTLVEAVGMFAIAVWDSFSRTLHLARDRMGEKPLHYGWHGGMLLFGSELKALRAHPAFVAEVDPSALHGYLQTGYIAAPRTVWRGISKLLPGTTVSFGPGDTGLLPAPTPYWSLMEVALRGQEQPFEGSDEEAVAALEHALGRAIQGQMVADVPLGAFLSGGIDSSTVVALMQARSSRRVRTFSIGFHEAGYDEAQHARAVAQYLGTDHTEMYVTSDDARGVVPSLPDMFDEPFGDSSAIPTYLVSKLARQHVTVALSGDGGDELFGGYARYRSTTRALSLMRRVPRPASLAIAGGASLMGLTASAILSRTPLACNVLRRQLALIALRANVFGCIATANSIEEAYSCVISQWHGTLPRNPNSWQLAEQMCPSSSALDAFHRLMLIDGLRYLPEDILTKVDRASMSSSLETRIPLLDHHVVESAWRLPLHLKQRHGSQKWILRQLLARHLPVQLIERPKMGFGVPVGDWIRGPLREWAESLLSDNALSADPLPRRRIRDGWKRHLRGEAGWRDKLWTVLMWQAWRSEHRSRTTPRV